MLLKNFSTFTRIHRYTLFFNKIFRHIFKSTLFNRIPPVAASEIQNNFNVYNCNWNIITFDFQNSYDAVLMCFLCNFSLSEFQDNMYYVVHGTYQVSNQVINVIVLLLPNSLSSNLQSDDKIFMSNLQPSKFFNFVDPLKTSYVCLLMCHLTILESFINIKFAYH